MWLIIGLIIGYNHLCPETFLTESLLPAACYTHHNQKQLFVVDFNSLVLLVGEGGGGCHSRSWLLLRLVGCLFILPSAPIVSFMLVLLRLMLFMLIGCCFSCIRLVSVVFGCWLLVVDFCCHWLLGADVADGGFLNWGYPQIIK